MVNVVNKGKDGERQAVKYLQPLVDQVYAGIELDYPDTFVQTPELHRNQNQSALGGYDLDGLPWIAIEIKRQENLSINQWWNQVLAACKDHQEPLLMFRQNRKKWRFMVWSYSHTGGSGYVRVRAEINEEDFQNWFKSRLRYEALKSLGLPC